VLLINLTNFIPLGISQRTTHVFHPIINHAPIGIVIGNERWKRFQVKVKHYSDHHGVQETLKAGSVMAVDELPQVVLIVPFEVVSGKGPTVEVAVRFGQGVSDQAAEVLSGVVHAVIIGTASADSRG